MTKRKFNLTRIANAFLLLALALTLAQPASAQTDIEQTKQKAAALINDLKYVVRAGGN